MRLTGWCRKCNKIKRVLVESFTNGAPVGVCDDCAD